MYVYIHSDTSPEGHWLWTVGFYDPDGNWIGESDHDKQEDAASRVAFLNGDVISQPDFNKLLRETHAMAEILSAVLTKAPPVLTIHRHGFTCRLAEVCKNLSGLIRE